MCIRFHDTYFMDPVFKKVLVDPFPVYGFLSWYHPQPDIYQLL